MRLYLASRRFPILLGASVLIGLSPSMSQVLVAFPGIIGGGEGTVVPLPAIAPLALAVLVAQSFTSRRTHLSDNAVRRTGWLDAALLLATDGLVACATLMAPTGDWTVARNVLILAGLAAIGTSLVSPSAGAASVTVFVLLVLTYGTSAPAARFVRVFQAPPNAPWPLALAVGVTLVAAGLLTRTNALGRLSVG
jgi:hypothetical protein